MQDYPYGHPFWLIKPEKEEFLNQDCYFTLGSFQDGHCFLNGFKQTPCHPDSYMTILEYSNVEKTFKILQDEYSFDKNFWIEFADCWINHTNKQPITCLLGFEIKRLIEK